MNIIFIHEYNHFIEVQHWYYYEESLVCQTTDLMIWNGCIWFNVDISVFNDKPNLIWNASNPISILLKKWSGYVKLIWEYCPAVMVAVGHDS